MYTMRGNEAGEFPDNLSRGKELDPSMCERVIMKKWPTLIKIGVWVFLCSFIVEYLNPSTVGVRAYYDPTLKYYSSLGNNSHLLKKSNPLIWASAEDHDHFR